MRKKLLVIIFSVLMFASVSVQYAAAAGSSTLKVKVLENKKITINIWAKKGKAVMYFMGNHMFKMSAKFVPIAGSTPDNLVQLKGNGFRSIHLNRSRKILYFREGKTGEFANVDIAEQGDKLVVTFEKNQGISLQIDKNAKKVVMYFKGNHMFFMSYKFLSFAGSTPNKVVELKGDGFRSIHLNIGRKILYFREGTTGEFAKVDIAEQAEQGDKLVVTFEKNQGISLQINKNAKKAVMYFMGNHMFKMSARFLPIAGSTPNNVIELKGDGFRSIHLNIGRKILYFREGTTGEFANVDIAEQGDKLVVTFEKNQGIALQINKNAKKAVMYFMGNHMFKMSAKFLPIAGSTPNNVIELKGNGFRSIHLNRSRKILYFREGTTGEFAKVSIE